MNHLQKGKPFDERFLIGLIDPKSTLSERNSRLMKVRLWVLVGADGLEAALVFQFD